MNPSARYLLLLLLFLVGTQQLGAQPKCKLEYFSTEQGLSHQAITGMLKDREGFTWFCSWDGLNRFDGQKFVTYKSSPGDQSQLGNDRLDFVLEDSKGDLWIEAYDRQIYRFQKSTNQFYPVAPIIQAQLHTHITFKSFLGIFDGLVWLLSDSDGIVAMSENIAADSVVLQFGERARAVDRIPSNTILFFKRDSLQRIWLGTSKGLACLEKSAAKQYQVNHSIVASCQRQIGFSAFDEDERQLYFGTTDGELMTVEKSSGNCSQKNISHTAINFLKKSARQNLVFASNQGGELISYHPAQGTTDSYPLKQGPLFSIFEDHRGKLWLEPAERGVLIFDPADHSSKYFRAKLAEGLNSISIRYKVFEDLAGNVWVNMKSGGFGYFDDATTDIKFTVSTSEAMEQPLPNFVYNILYDNTGIIWFTTNDRLLVKMVLQDNSIRQKMPMKNPGNRWDNEVRGIAYDHLGRLWVGAKGGKLYVYDDEKEVTQIFDNPPDKTLGLIYAILPDSRGNIWLGTKLNGLFKAAPVNKEQTRYHLQHFAADVSKPGHLNCNEIYALLEDGPGRIWIGSFDAGLVLAVDDDAGTRFYHKDNAFSKLPSSHRKIRKLALDASGNLWMGTTGGLLVMDPGKTKKGVYYTSTYTKQPGQANSLGNNDVQYVFRDAQNDMWLGTSGGGFIKAAGNDPLKKLQFRNYTIRDGLPNDYVLSITQDGQGDIWMATENGLSSFNKKTGAFRNYDTYDGFPSGHYSEAAVVRNSEDGKLVFGSTKGIIYFDPANINKQLFPADIAFTHLQINNKIAGPGQQGSTLQKDVNYLDQLELKYNQNIISIDYAVMDNRTGVHQPAEYRLLGFDTVWHEDRELRRATYTNLPPGDYMFEVRTSNADAYINHPYRQLAISILPPPWKTWWAYLLYAVALVAAFLFARRTALTMIRLRNKIALEQKLASLKSNFFTQVSHELRTPLTLIQSPIDQILRKEPLTSEGRSYAELARKNASRMLRFVNQLLDFRKVESNQASMHYSTVEVVGFTRRICEHFLEAARVKHVRLLVDCPHQELYAWLDADKLDVVLYNIIGNALKFTTRGKPVNIEIKKASDGEKFRIAVHDHGPGVSKDQLNNIFELFYEADPTGAREQKGSGIGLALSSEFVKLHGGRIWAENNEHGGLSVMVELAIGKNPGTSFVDNKEPYVGNEIVNLPIEQQVLQPVARPSATPKQSKLVLLVEDNNDLRSFLRQQLSEFYRVETAQNGESGLRKAIELEPDLVVSDVMMPVMSGIEMLDRLRNDINTSHIPVVLLTAKSSVESQIEGLAYGADFYITKPFNLEYLLACIDNLVKQRKRLFDSMLQHKKQVTLSATPVVVTSRDEVFLKEVIRQVEEKMADADFNMESLAESMAMSRSTFSKKFKSLTGLTSVEFVRDIRLQKAKQLLEAGLQVAEVAYTIGFNNPKYFSTCFREKYRMSPSDYAKAKTLD